MESTITHTQNQTQAKSQTRPLQPLGWLASLLLFGLPAAGMALAVYGIRPWFESLGYSPLISYLGALTIPLALLFAAALVGFHRVEGYPLTRQAFSERMRFPRLRGRDLLAALLVFALGMAGYYLLSQLSLVLIDNGLILLPQDLPLLADPQAVLDAGALDRAAGGQIQGQWELVLLFAVTFFFNIAGEELWWRGYILPRQELAFGRQAWLLNGLLWAAFHAFKWWDVLALIPICLLIAYSAQKLQSNWAAVIAHTLFNLSGFVVILAAVAGWL